VGVTDGVTGRDMNVDDFVQEIADLATEDSSWLCAEVQNVSEYDAFPAALNEAALALAV
jgi:hypothetical protein